MIDRATREGRGPVLWLLGIGVGLVAGFATLGLRLGIALVEQTAYGVTDPYLATHAATLPYLRLILVPVTTGVVVASLYYLGMRFGLVTNPAGKTVADLLEARAVKGGKVELRSGLYSAVLSAISLGGGASGGREGPAVHLGGTMGSALAAWLNMPPRASRILLACGAAAAVSASFNAPVAGALFAFEVVLGHYALRSIAPVAVASVVGALVLRLYPGEDTVFGELVVGSAGLWDYPAAAVLGIAAAGLAIVFDRGVLHGPPIVSNWAERIGFPLWLLPIPGGLLVGLLALIAPEILGVGYETTSNALHVAYPLQLLLLFIVLKVVATTITLAFRFAGGVFSPSIYLGAMLGSAFGLVMVTLFGDATAGAGFFAVIGMGAVAGAVLGAPLSTTLIVFELTSSYEASVAVLVSVSLATILTQSALGASLFQRQVMQFGYDISGGSSRLVLQTVRVRDFMLPLDQWDKSDLATGNCLYEDDTLDRALGMLDAEQLDGAPVRSRSGDQPVIGWVTQAEAQAAYARRLAEISEEEHR